MRKEKTIEKELNEVYAFLENNKNDYLQGYFDALCWVLGAIDVLWMLGDQKPEKTIRMKQPIT